MYTSDTRDCPVQYTRAQALEWAREQYRTQWLGYHIRPEDTATFTITYSDNKVPQKFLFTGEELLAEDYISDSIEFKISYVEPAVEKKPEESKQKFVDKDAMWAAIVACNDGFV